MKNMFDLKDCTEVINRINQLTPDAKNLWGKMSVDQMLAHCNVPYGYIYTDKYQKPNAFKKFMITLFAKKMVVGNKPYPKNSRTAPEFIITDKKHFEKEKTLLIDNIKRTQNLGETHFKNRESHSFGPLSVQEWNTMFYKHLDHHLKQFNV
ncbi:hypothetical protein APS56_04255 [Pseudalgibacter alginicilyticus]|uniref:DUF1569 domain-containing protein n=1 Tax=Pseudalgibacter alginicilyticus TaxID=1736674 RepID=A0A0P0CNJ8_9FLAO|nr:DUF1569 domain-containing protein [Pseudalgibacter alginicilyticus]ALJ04397.1 hypothetical protein APS56_04255 [Pseudalgibacter alginicilyticus]